MKEEMIENVWKEIVRLDKDYEEKITKIVEITVDHIVNFGKILNENFDLQNDDLEIPQKLGDKFTHYMIENIATVYAAMLGTLTNIIKEGREERFAIKAIAQINVKTSEKLLNFLQRNVKLKVFESHIKY